MIKECLLNWIEPTPIHVQHAIFCLYFFFHKDWRNQEYLRQEKRQSKEGQSRNITDDYFLLILILIKHFCIWNLLSQIFVEFQYLKQITQYCSGWKVVGNSSAQPSFRCCFFIFPSPHGPQHLLAAWGTLEHDMKDRDGSRKTPRLELKGLLVSYAAIEAFVNISLSHLPSQCSRKNHTIQVTSQNAVSCYIAQ